MRMTLNEIAKLVKGHVLGDPDCIIEGVGPIDAAKKGEITFAEKGAGLKQLGQTNASAALVPQDVSKAAIPVIQVENPRIAFAKLLGHFHPMQKPAPGIHSTASIGDHCQVGDNVFIGAGVVVGNDVTIGDDVVLHPLVVLGDNVTIGQNSVIYPHVSILERCRIGERVIIHAGSIIGSDGFVSCGFIRHDLLLLLSRAFFRLSTRIDY